MITRYLPFVAGAAIGAIYVRARRERLAVERLGAATFETLLDAIDANSPETGLHVRRVAEYALILAKAADIDERGQRSIERVALFHDIGKLDGAISDIVSESTKLSAAERTSIMTHPAKGAEVLGPLAWFYPDLPAGVIAHHERWDGTGYPKRLKGDETVAVQVIVFPFLVEAQVESWKEQDQRSLQWFGYRAAASRVAEPSLRRLIREFGAEHSTSFVARSLRRYRSWRLSVAA